MQPSAMAYTKDYYRILGLIGGTSSPPSSSSGSSSTNISTEEVRRAYKLALLNAHPDKRGAAGEHREDKRESGRQNGMGHGCDPGLITQTSQSQTTTRHTIDEIKEAYAHLADAQKKAEYDRWWTVQARWGGGAAGATTTTSGAGAGVDATATNAFNADFILGLEILDLADFEARPRARCEPAEQHGLAGARDDNPDPNNVPRHCQTGHNDTQAAGKDGHDDVGDADYHDNDNEQAQTEWTRSCRCGAQPGFAISEHELEAAERRGEREVLVGCGGCSLWVRVGFDVEDD
ncbi:hypothetical protein IAQ61_001847 [Plenodomus lingam]|uniref:uncharacterized protein n=1 Tax=Leptosphaeria maculans TaxID=5022 RepID=UPI00331F0979|nr:hypothetical protein IAQ61_001847 [Plenodomus lingam]